jgi:tripartite-type tricarboxylate transporter receptor subunit TctC
MKTFVSALILSVVATSAQAQAPMRVFSGFPPGGAVDALARLFAEPLSAALERPVVVENRPGASGQIAASALKAAPADGNTLMVAPDSALTLYPHIMKSPVYDTLADFTAVAHLGSFPIGIGIALNVPASDLAQWVKWAGSSKKNALYGHTGSGSNLHFLGVMLAQATGVPLEPVSYRGVGPALADLLGGQVPAALLPLAQMYPMAQAGKMRLLAHSGAQRTPVAPEVPTFRELGYPTLELNGWYVLIARSGLPPEHLARLNQIINQAMRTDVVRARMRALDLDIQEMTPAELAVKLRSEHERWRPIVKASGFSMDGQ